MQRTVKLKVTGIPTQVLAVTLTHLFGLVISNRCSTTSARIDKSELCSGQIHRK